MTALNIVALGDSLTQGFVHGATNRPRLAYPSILARALGVPDERHRVLEDEGPGFPIDVAKALSYVHARVGDELTPASWLLKLPYHVGKYLDIIEDHYERGPGKRPLPTRDIPHNLACFGVTVNEALMLHSAACQLMIDVDEGVIEDDFFAIPSPPIYRNAQMVLNPSADPKRERCTMIDNLRELAEREPIDVLLLWLGNNDALQTVLHMEVGEMPEDFEGTGALDRQGIRLTSAPQFERDFTRLTAQLDEILASAKGRRQVYVGLVPHVTIPPVTRGLGTMDANGYFEFYGRFYRDPSSTGGELLLRNDVVHIDRRIDDFNHTIAKLSQARGWTVIDTVGIIDRLAVKRNGFERNPGQALRNDLEARGYPHHPLLELDPVPSLLPYRVVRTPEGPRRVGGGIFGLDHVHPSTIGYALIAEAFLDAIKTNNPKDRDIQGAAIDWERVIGADELISAPPLLWSDLSAALEKGSSLWTRLMMAAG